MCSESTQATCCVLGPRMRVVDGARFVCGYDGNEGRGAFGLCVSVTERGHRRRDGWPIQRERARRGVCVGVGVIRVAVGVRVFRRLRVRAGPVLCETSDRVCPRTQTTVTDGNRWA